MLNISHIVACFITVTFLLVSTGVMAADDKAALSGLSDAKVSFDLKEGDAKLLLNRLEIIDETR